LFYVYRHPGTGYEREDQQKHEEVALLQRDARTRHKKQNSRFDINRIPEGKRPRENPRKQLYISSNDVPTSNYRHNGPKTSPLLTNAIEKAGFDPYNYKRKNGGDTGYRRQTTSPSKPTEEKSTWNLQTYEGVIDALLTGHKVYFTAHTKNCFHEHARKREQTTFGDYVDVFEIQKDFSIKQPNKLLQFSLKRMQHTKRRGMHVCLLVVFINLTQKTHFITLMLQLRIIVHIIRTVMASALLRSLLFHNFKASLIFKSKPFTFVCKTFLCSIIFIKSCIQMKQSFFSGFKEIIREVTVHRNSTVHILTVILNEDGNIDRNSYAECNLYNQDTG
jgi:hypothetical protein